MHRVAFNYLSNALHEFTNNLDLSVNYLTLRIGQMSDLSEFSLAMRSQLLKNFKQIAH